MATYTKETKNAMALEMARFISDLKRGLEQTTRTEDRPLFQSYLGQAAVIISKVLLDANQADLFNEIEANERLWGYSYLTGDWNQKFPDSYEAFKDFAGYHRSQS